VLKDVLRIHWKWLEKEGSLISWQGVDFTVSKEAEEMARTAIQCTGKGREQASGCKGETQRR
jgi:hypothetical protein